MVVLKPFISTLLLGVYLLGYTHTLTPHCESSCDGNDFSGIHHHPDHLDHSDLEKIPEDNENISHGDHFDHGWIDLYVCTLSNLGHQDSGNHAEHFPMESEIRDCSMLFKSLDAPLIFVPGIAFKAACESNITADETLPILFEESIYRYQPVKETPFRGPPFYSC